MPKVAIVTDWLTNIGGGEKVLSAITEIFPLSPIYTTVVNKKNIGTLASKKIITSFLQSIPLLYKKHQLLLPLLPMGIESLNLNGFDLIISLSSSVAKAVLTNPEQMHVCYIHTPMRYAWEPYFDERVSRMPFYLKPFLNIILFHLRIWDKVTSSRPDLYIANSTTTAARVRKYYKRDSVVLYPPVDTKQFYISEEKDDYFFLYGRMVAYKKFELVAETFIRLSNKKLIIAGSGPYWKKIKKIVNGHNNITLLGQLSSNDLKERLSKAKAVILPQKEDAGIVQLEAFASGVPVIAFKSGGILDVLKENINGIYFDEQNYQSLSLAINNFEKMKFNPKKIRATSFPYDKSEFQRKFIEIIKKHAKGSL